MKKNTYKVIIGVPCAESGTMKAKTAGSIGRAIIAAQGMVINFILRVSCDIVANRVWLVKEAIKEGATHILFVDADMVFPANTVEHLLAHDKDIVGVEYNKRQFPLELAITPSIHSPVLLERSATELYPQVAAGTGLLLIKLSVFEKIIDDPWFNFGRNAEGETVMGEDIWFCNVARDAGFDIWIDPTLKVGHVGEFVY